MNKYDFIKMKVIKRLIKESRKKDLQDFVVEKYFNQVISENNIILSESHKKEILVTAALIFSLLGLGLSAKEVSTVVKDKIKTPIAGNTLSGTHVSDEQVERATIEINNTLEKYRNAAQKLDSDESTLEYLNNLKIILDKANDSIESYSSSQDNIYLHSIYVTKVFASSPGLYRSFPKNGRYIKLNSNQRNVLFYRLVVGKTPQFMKNAEIDKVKISNLNIRKIKLTDDEMSESQSHPAWPEYLKSVESIKKTNGDSYFHIWLNSGLAKVTKRIIGKSSKGSEKVSWCAANSGFILSYFLAKNLEDIEQGKTSGSVWASTHKIYENYKNSNVLVFSKDSLDKNESEESRVSKVSTVIIPGSFITVGEGKSVGTHAMMVVDVDYENQTVDVIAGNHGNAVQLVPNVHFNKIKMVLNVPELGDPEKNTGIYKLSAAVRTLPASDLKKINKEIELIAATH